MGFAIQMARHWSVCVRKNTLANFVKRPREIPAIQTHAKMEEGVYQLARPWTVLVILDFRGDFVRKRWVSTF